jgi:hypothetical protein
MLEEMNRRSFLELGVAAGAAAMLPRAISAQAAQKAAQPKVSAATTQIKTTKLYDNVYLLQGTGGNMALQTGPEGSLLIDSSYASDSAAHPRGYRLGRSGCCERRPTFALVNTHLAQRPHWKQRRECTRRDSRSLRIRIPARVSPRHRY